MQHTDEQVAQMERDLHGLDRSLTDILNDVGTAQPDLMERQYQRAVKLYDAWLADLLPRMEEVEEVYDRSGESFYPIKAFELSPHLIQLKNKFEKQVDELNRLFEEKLGKKLYSPT